MKALILTALIAVSVPAVAAAVPQPGRALPSVSVTDLGGTHHTERDLHGGWTVAFAMTDKDVGPTLEAWFRQVQPRVSPRTRLINLIALDLFALVPTSTILSQAREQTPRNAWGSVWFSRDGSLANQLGLPDSETPWVFVIDPAGHVVECIHATVDAGGIARVISALSNVRTASAAP